MDYMRHAMKTKDAEIDVLKKKWQEYQEVQERMSNYEKDRMGEKDLLRKRAEQIDALQHKVTFAHAIISAHVNNLVLYTYDLLNHTAADTQWLLHCCIS